jgi:hypothetical protein
MPRSKWKQFSLNILNSYTSRCEDEDSRICRGKGQKVSYGENERHLADGCGLPSTKQKAEGDRDELILSPD